MSSPAMYDIGTHGIKHQAVAYFVLLLGPTFPLVWSALSAGEITWNVEVPYVTWLVASIWLLISIVGGGLHYYSRSESVESKVQKHHNASALINDKAFLLTSFICSLAFFLFSMEVYIKWFNVPPATNLTNTFYFTNITLFTSVGVERLVVKTLEQGVGVLLSLVTIICFFMPWSQAALLNIGTEEVTETSKFNAQRDTPIGKWASQKSEGRV